MSWSERAKQGRDGPKRVSSKDFERAVWGVRIQDDKPVYVDPEAPDVPYLNVAEREGGDEPETVEDQSVPEGAGVDIDGLVQITNRAFRNNDVFFVRSASTHGKFYMVIEGNCTCKGYTYRQTCNHITHLEKEGFLIHDVRNGGYVPAEGGNAVDRALTVRTGIRHSLAGSGSEIEARDAQIRRVQSFARAQQRVIDEQRRLISSLRLGSSAGVLRATKMLEMANRLMDERAGELVDGDLVELDQ